MNPGNLLCLPLSRLHAVSLSNAALHRRFRCGVANPSLCATFKNARRTDELLGLNLAIPSAVCSGFRYSGFRFT
jgi:hypothetical protein